MRTEATTIYRRPAANRGFTLIELLLALTIFAVGILAVATMQTMSINGNAKARKHTEASVFLSDQVETLMTLPYGHDDLEDLGADHAAVTHTSGYIPYSTVWNVDDVDPDFKEVTVTVTWQDRGHTVNKSVTFLKPRDLF